MEASLKMRRNRLMMVLMGVTMIPKVIIGFFFPRDAQSAITKSAVL